MPLPLIATLMSISCLAITLGDARRGHAQASQRPAMFVFGSSYVDTGNVSPGDRSRPYPWSKPYGETWPGKPAGRYGNGLVLTDVVAQALNLKVPPTFAKRRVGINDQPNGLSFAVGGSGVLLSTEGRGAAPPPISSQIDALRTSLVANSYSPQALASAIVLYCTAGDDYFSSLAGRPSISSVSDLYPLTVSVGKQIAADLVRLYGMGLRKFMVTYLPPTGCLPIVSGESLYRACDDTWTAGVAQPHNARVLKNVLGLRHYFRNGTIVLLDLFSAFSSALSTIGNGSLRPCCIGKDMRRKCGDVGAGASPTYSLCSNPDLSFFWDDIIHPTQAGWQKIGELLKPSISQIVK